MEAPGGGAAPPHIVSVPFPGRGLINPMINLCKLLLSKQTNLLITFVVSEEWRALIGSDLIAGDNLHSATIPDGILLPERLKASERSAFMKALMTKMAAPFEDILDGLTPPANVIVSSTEMSWVVGVGNRRNIPVVSLWTMSASFFCTLYPRLLREDNPEFLNVVSGKSNDDKNNQNQNSITEEDHQMVLEEDHSVIDHIMKSIALVPKAKCILISSIYKLEAQVMETIQKQLKFPVPINIVGPLIPYFDLNKTDLSPYKKWLDSQPSCSVLYISFGSFLTPSKPQMHEIMEGLRASGVRFLWMAGKEAPYLEQHYGTDYLKREGGDHEMGLVIPWCDQLKVLSHPSVGGFWTHCGWNSTMEAMISGVPMLCYPLFLDQLSNCKQIVEKWKIGWRVKELIREDYGLVTRNEIAELVKRFMDLSDGEMIEMRRRANDLKDVCLRAVSNVASSSNDLDALLNQ